MPRIKELVLKECAEHKHIFDVFGGTGVVTAGFLDIADEIVINDFLFSNEIIYKAFFSQSYYDIDKLKSYKDRYCKKNKSILTENYISINYGDKYFSLGDARMIGVIREDIESSFLHHEINEHEYNILLASLIYSLDKCANTVGHYEAYIKNHLIDETFIFELIEPISTSTNVEIYREDSNNLARSIHSDIAFVDPPYNSRQYSRFYHVLETVVKWDFPELSGVAMKPPAENMSSYCKKDAPRVFDDLIKNLDAKYIVVTYNNTYNSKSSSSRNKITLSQIRQSLENRGSTDLFEMPYSRFNAGKTDSVDHKELLFITKVGK